MLRSAWGVEAEGAMTSVILPRRGLAANQAVDKEESKGTILTPAPDVPGFADSIDALIDEVAGELNGS